MHLAVNSVLNMRSVSGMREIMKEVLDSCIQIPWKKHDLGDINRNRQVAVFQPGLTCRLQISPYKRDYH